jgi:hypothetical protein
MRASLPRGGRRPTPGSLVLQACNSVNPVLQACNSPFESENSHFFKCLFTKMAFCVVGGWESAQGLAGSPLMRKNAWICFSTSFSFVCSNPSLQIRSFGGNRGKCNQQYDPTDGLFCSFLMRQDLHVADSSYLLWNEAYEHCLTLVSHLLLMPCWEGKPNERHFFADIFIKQWFCSKHLCRICCMLSVYGLQFMISPSLSLGFNFHIQIDFGFNDLFSHIFSFLHHKSIETSWFSHIICQKPLTEEKSMQSSLDTCRSMLPPPISRRAHLRSQKKEIKPN